MQYQVFSAVGRLLSPIFPQEKAMLISARTKMVTSAVAVLLVVGSTITQKLLLQEEQGRGTTACTAS